MTGRREFFRALGSLACVGLGGCKIEPILGLDSEDVPLPLAFPELPPQIPDQLADAETTLRALTEQLLERETMPLTVGELRERPSQDSRAVSHLQDLLRRCGASPAGEGGEWLQSVMLDIVEPTGAAATIRLRPDNEASDRAIDLAPLGAFRQRGPAEPHTALSLSPVLDYATALVHEKLEGRVALVRMPAELDLDDPSAPAHVDVLMSSVRDAGASGCLLLTDDEGPVIERFRARWQRQVRRPGDGDAAMAIEGLLGKAAQAAIEEGDGWVLDVDLATRNFQVQSHNLLGAVLGREQPNEVVMLTCAWDTADPLTLERDTTRLLTSLAAFFQVAEWSRRSTPPKYSVVLLLSVDAGLAAGTVVHAARAAELGVRPKAVLALDRPTREPSPAVVLSGHYDTATADLARRVVSADGRDLLLAEQLALPSLAPYLRNMGPVMSIGAPAPDALASTIPSSTTVPDAEDPLAGLFTDVRVLRNLLFALANG